MRKWDSSLFDLPRAGGCAVQVYYNDAVSPAAETALIAGKRALPLSWFARTGFGKVRCAMRKWDSSLFDLPRAGGCAVHVYYNEAAVSPAAGTALIAGEQFLRPSKAVRPTSREKGRCEGPAFTHTPKNADHYNTLQRKASLHLCLFRHNQALTISLPRL